MDKNVQVHAYNLYLFYFTFIYLSYIEYTNNLNSTKNSSENEKQYIYTHTPRDMHILNLIHFHTEEFQQSVKISCCKTAIRRKYTTVTSIPHV